jgi:hypothetical protein
MLFLNLSVFSLFLSLCLSLSLSLCLLSLSLSFSLSLSLSLSRMQMNRGVCLQRPEPSTDDIQRTGHSILAKCVVCV